MAHWTKDDHYDSSSPHAHEVHVQDLPEESKILGPDGRPLRYQKPVFGFDLRPKERKP